MRFIKFAGNNGCDVVVNASQILSVDTVIVSGLDITEFPTIAELEAAPIENIKRRVSIGTPLGIRWYLTPDDITAIYTDLRWSIE